MTILFTPPAKLRRNDQSSLGRVIENAGDCPASDSVEMTLLLAKLAGAVY